MRRRRHQKGPKREEAGPGEGQWVSKAECMGPWRAL